MTGIETADGAMTVLIRKNSLLPTKNHQVFSTFNDNQKSIEIQVYEGEHSVARENNFLGVFEHKDIPLAPKGSPAILITIELDINGIFSLSSKEHKTPIPIRPDPPLSKEKIDEMMKEAERIQVSEDLEARHRLEQLVYSTRNKIRDEEFKLGSKVDSWDIKRLEDSVNEAIEWMDFHQAATIQEYETKREELVEVVTTIFAKFAKSDL